MTNFVLLCLVLTLFMIFSRFVSFKIRSQFEKSSLSKKTILRIVFAIPAVAIALLIIFYPIIFLMKNIQENKLPISEIWAFTPLILFNVYLYIEKFIKDKNSSSQESIN